MKKLVFDEKIKLSGFNNLTKVLSFNLYDFCIALDEQERRDYVQYINEKYSAKSIRLIGEQICSIIKAEILAVNEQDYDPVGASSMILMSDYMGGGWNGPHKSSDVSMHLDKSHITAHTYPEAGGSNGICSFRVDIDIATCGEISPLKAINILFEHFECDVVYIDYVVRGFTRMECGTKIYNDSYFNSIQDFIEPQHLNEFRYKVDLNLPNSNIWQTKLMVKDFPISRYLMHPEKVEGEQSEDFENRMRDLKIEMAEVFHLSS